MKRFLTALTSLFASRAFFIGVVVFFVFEAVWFAFSALYPMAFDEDFHFGLIKMYATHWSPFLTVHPTDADAFGAVTRDPSYLYHYLMSFPYRLLTHIVGSETVQIIILRLLNVAMFTGALVLFRRFLQRVTHSNAFTNVALAIFILIPIVPQLAAHINYDNLLIILVAWSCLLATDIHRQFTAHRIDFRTVATLIVVSLLASVVKYAFLPLFLGLVVFVVYDGWINFRHTKRFSAQLRQNWGILRMRTKMGLLLTLVIGGGLFFQRFGINAIQFHNPIPSCDQVLTIDHCAAYGPWNRDYNLAKNKGDFNKSPIAYGVSWIHGMWWRLFFAINSSARNYTNYPPLPFPVGAGLVTISVVVLSFIVYLIPTLRGQPLLQLCTILVVIYCSTLFLQDYEMFLDTGQPVAINGRYLLPILPLVAAVGWRSITLAMAKLRLQAYRPLMALIVMLCFVQGGGVFTFIMRSDASWDWPNATIIRINNTARTLLKPVIIQGSKQTKTTL